MFNIESGAIVAMGTYTCVFCIHFMEYKELGMIK